MTEDTSPHVTSERQNPDTALDPRFQSGPLARSSFDPKKGRFSKYYGADQQRLLISDLHFDKFPTPTTFACWKVIFKTEVCTCSQFPTEAVLWIKEVEMVESVDDLKSSSSIFLVTGTNDSVENYADPYHSDLPEWLQEFTVPDHRHSHAGSSHEPSSGLMRSADLGKHSVYTHFPKDRNYKGPVQQSRSYLVQKILVTCLQPKPSLWACTAPSLPPSRLPFSPSSLSSPLLLGLVLLWGLGVWFIVSLLCS